MKRSILLLGIVTLSLIATTQTLGAGSDGKLDEVLANMERAARGIKTIEAEMNQEKRDMQIGGKEIYRGRIFFAHSKTCDKVRINYSIPENR